MHMDSDLQEIHLAFRSTEKVFVLSASGSLSFVYAV